MKSQLGASLIEILVTVVILSIGLLGLAALQTNGLRFNHDAQMRSIAVTQVRSMINRMGANQEGITTGLYNLPNAGTGVDPRCNTTCSIQQIAQRDIFTWNTYNAQALPDGRGTITPVGNLYRIAVHWNSNRRDPSTLGMGCSGDPDVDFDCVQVIVRF